QHRQGRHVESKDVRSAASTGAGDDVRQATAVGQAGSHPYAAQEGWIVGEEAGQESSVGDLGVGLDLVEFGAVDGLDVRPTAGACSRENVGVAVAVEVPGRHIHAAGKGRSVCEEAAQQSAVGDLEIGLKLCELGAVDHLDVRSAAWAGGSDDVRS